MNILVFNCGSSSLTYKVFKSDSVKNTGVAASGKAHRVGVTGTESSFIEHKIGSCDKKKDILPIKTHRDAAGLILQDLTKKNKIDIDLIGHRFVHGGNYFKNSAFINADTLEKLNLCLPLAPIHNPVSLSVIYECQRTLPNARQYVTFDSAFHSNLPAVAFTYALPATVTEKLNYRKYGFHGLSYLNVLLETERFLKTGSKELKIVACHLGTGGSSIAAVKDGHSIDTSMGYSPLTGLVMSTRCGDIDPMLTIYLMSVYGYRPDDLLDLLTKQSGLLGISGFSSDIRDIIKNISPEDKEQAELAFGMYIYRIKKYIGSYITFLGGADVLVFTDDIGIYNWQVREKVCENMDWCGISLDNQANHDFNGQQIARLSKENAPVDILCIPADEERVICLEGINLLSETGDKSR
ncbi:MAG: acetate/propionate family kinase [Phycisphaerae bacterium]|nr:acetate/propionate family kinase [Phycisphaerae bacterium]